MVKRIYFETLALLVEVEGVAKPDDKDQIEDAEEGCEDGNGCPGEAHKVDRDRLEEGYNHNGLMTLTGYAYTSKTRASARR